MPASSPSKAASGHRKQASSSSAASSSVSTLPEYRRSRHTPSTSLSAIWDREENPSPPPDYSAPEQASSAEDADGETERVSPPIRRRVVRHRRSSSGRGLLKHEPSIDDILERSVHALEMSNSLLQSSMSTRTSLSNAFSDDPILDQAIETQTHYLSTRFSISEEQEAGFSDLMNNVEALIVEDISTSQSAPPSSNLHDLISPDHYLGRAPLAKVQAPGDQSAVASRATTPSQGNRGVHRSSVSSTNRLARPTVTDALPSPATPAYHLLSSIVSRTLRLSPSHGQRTSSPFRAQPSNQFPRGWTNASSIDLLHTSNREQMPGRLRKSRSVGDMTSPQTHQVERFPRSSLAPLISPRFFTRQAPVRPATEQASPSKSVQALRKILVSSISVGSEVAQGKAVAVDERETTVPERRRFHPRRTPAPTLALVGPSGVAAMVSPSSASITVSLKPAQKSAMKRRMPSPGRSSRSTPRNVSFSPLPPSSVSVARRAYRSKPLREGVVTSSGRRWLPEWWGGGIPSDTLGRADFARDQVEGWMV